MKNLILKFILLLSISITLGLTSRNIGLNTSQALAISIFSISILGTLFFWDFRLAFAFIGISILLMTHTIDLEHMVKFASLDVILFLVGMMVLVALMKESGFFAWIVQLILRVRKMTAIKFVFIISFASAILSTMTSEVVSIIFMVAAILEICDYFEVDSVPYIIICILATNIGSAATVLGNPIGILIASKAGLTFEDFIIKAFPMSMVCLTVTIFLVIFWYRESLKKLDKQIEKLGANEMLIQLISVPPDKQLKVSLSIFAVTLAFIALHHRLELLWNLEPNTILLTMPLFSSGCVMMWKWRRARDYIEKDVEWWTLLFFMLLFAQAGTLKYTGATDVLAQKLVSLAGHNLMSLTGLVLWVSAIGSSILDNVVLVAAFIPVIQSFQALNLNLHPLWWALLFGGCFGGNITIVGSTANIVALGIMEKEKDIKISFLQWFWIGSVVGIITTSIVWAGLTFLPFYR
ncbi:MAG: anion permease [Candidatus Omnitrophica bacterium]|nr:anion permease [Candidatus Omnitrophota bacterium]